MKDRPLTHEAINRWSSHQRPLPRHNLQYSLRARRMPAATASDQHEATSLTTPDMLTGEYVCCLTQAREDERRMSVADQRGAGDAPSAQSNQDFADGANINEADGRAPLNPIPPRHPPRHIERKSHGLISHISAWGAPNGLAAADREPGTKRSPDANIRCRAWISGLWRGDWCCSPRLSR